MYANYLAQRGEPLPPPLVFHRKAEAAATQQLRAALERHEIFVVDSAPALLAELQADRAVWPASPDGHLNPAGAEVVAHVLLEALEL